MAKEHSRTPYAVNIDFSPAEQSRLKYFLNVMHYKSIRHFIREAILEKMANDLAKLSGEKRKAIETLLKENVEPQSDSLV